MSRKRDNSGSRRDCPYQVHQQSTSPQQINYEDSLAAECLIRIFMEKCNMEDAILKMVFIGGSRSRSLVKKAYGLLEGEKGQVQRSDGLLRLRMKEVGINTEVNRKLTKYSIMGATLVTYQRFGQINFGRRKDSQKILNGNFRNNQFIRMSNQNSKGRTSDPQMGQVP
ncbi:unnamed protein product (macronuclear) [Paramecium tetraurelia]|uniref:Uncharacterized protein n=1 Tax=Paramecium tetraurelia TaxID=5888 RepID=A0D134_PARTE|nr:uncharacterized protein GSPATT00039166001 [Paramecium tetraurelia]CAK76751.1 unnamed protein product [Paramecium tetraurelia]|eukprot:XP_001444148.1 hypothetical protein (macronuclear) [Paramecium tetraurelia strain d4-2]